MLIDDFRSNKIFLLRENKFLLEIMIKIINQSLEKKISDFLYLKKLSNSSFMILYSELKSFTKSSTSILKSLSS